MPEDLEKSVDDQPFEVLNLKT